MSRPPIVHLVPHGADLPARVAARVLDWAGPRAPDLTGAVVLLPPGCGAAALRRALLDAASTRGLEGLLGPFLQPLQQWVDEHGDDPTPVVPRHARVLILVEALRGHAQLFGEEDPWRVADSLLELFDQLTLHGCTPDTDADAFARRLRNAYGIAAPAPAALVGEARIVHSLWHAWHSQLAAGGMADAATLYHRKLTRAAAALPTDGRIFLVGYPQLTAAEADWVAALAAMDKVEVFLPGSGDDAYPDAAIATLLARFGPPDRLDDATPLGACLDAVFPRADVDLPARAAACRQHYAASPLHGHLATFGADSTEQEAQAISLQVRRWLLDGHQPVAVVTEDRRLARRLRALLERAGLQLQDAGGWALSTTSAAAAVERWLETVEEDFGHRPLLDLLKSPFACADGPRDEHLAAVHHLEQDIVQRENIARGLDRYRRQVRSRQDRLGTGAAPGSARLLTLLTRLEQAAAPLRPLLDGRRRHPAATFLDALRTSLDTLGMWSALAADAAGQRVVQEWSDLRRSADHSPVRLAWLEFRTWFGRTLEQHNFRPATGTEPVLLLNLEQSRLGRFAALVVAGCDRDHLPGGSGATPFFNDRVRRNLGLPTWRDHLQARLYHFRALLEAAPRVLLTWHREDNGEPVLPSPWLEALRAFQRLAWGTALDDLNLAALVSAPGSQPRPPAPAPLPQPAGAPAPALRAGLRREAVSASAHQRLIDCPYRYFAGDCLRLRPREEVREALAKSDYGERVHRCLQAFHTSVRGLPGPFDGPVTTANASAAEALLRDIGRAVFAHDLEDNFLHRGWLRRWERQIPLYVEWQRQRDGHWRVAATEQRTTRPLLGGTVMEGRLDRIDRAPEGWGVIDYKTGQGAPQADVDAGEAVQLPTYAALLEGPVARVEYLLLDDSRGVRSGAYLEGEPLDALREGVTARLRTVLADMDGGVPLPAWGDPQTCAYCEMDGLCRRQAWTDGDPK